LNNYYYKTIPIAIVIILFRYWKIIQSSSWWLWAGCAKT